MKNTIYFFLSLTALVWAGCQTQSQEPTKSTNYNPILHAEELVKINTLPLPAIEKTITPFTATNPESRILGQATNKIGEKVIVREIFVSKEIAQESGNSSRHCYRFEFYSMGFLVSCATRWDGEPETVTVKWTSSTKCHVSMLNDWLRADFDSEEYFQGGWTFRRRID